MIFKEVGYILKKLQVWNEKSDITVVPEISTVLLNWNRIYLLKKTIFSYIETISVPFELIIIDNGSTDGSQEFIKNFCKNKSNCDSIFLTRNKGGKALNLGLKRSKAKFLHVSENDFTYKIGWDKKMLKTFKRFPELGQLSLFAPFKKQNTSKIVKGDCAIYVTNRNIGTSSMFRREIWDQGVRWENIGTGYKFPNDSAFSRAVKSVGYVVAWTDKTLVINHGHQIDEYRNNLSYYIENYKSKPWLGIQGFKNRLQKVGYTLVETDSTESGYTIVSSEKQ